MLAWEMLACMFYCLHNNTFFILPSIVVLSMPYISQALLNSYIHNTHDLQCILINSNTSYAAFSIDIDNKHIQ